MKQLLKIFEKTNELEIDCDFSVTEGTITNENDTLYVDVRHEPCPSYTALFKACVREHKKPSHKYVIIATSERSIGYSTNLMMIKAQMELDAVESNKDLGNATKIVNISVNEPVKTLFIDTNYITEVA